jgi:hypothetical protein
MKAILKTSNTELFVDVEISWDVTDQDFFKDKFFSLPFNRIEKLGDVRDETDSRHTGIVVTNVSVVNLPETNEPLNVVSVQDDVEPVPKPPSFVVHDARDKAAGFLKQLINIAQIADSYWNASMNDSRPEEGEFLETLLLSSYVVSSMKIRHDRPALHMRKKICYGSMIWKDAKDQEVNGYRTDFRRATWNPDIAAFIYPVGQKLWTIFFTILERQQCLIANEILQYRPREGNEIPIGGRERLSEALLRPRPTLLDTNILSALKAIE